jgi:hypothetical protein
MQREAPPEVWHPLQEQHFNITIWPYREEGWRQVPNASNAYWQEVAPQASNPYSYMRYPDTHLNYDFSAFPHALHTLAKMDPEWPQAAPISAPVEPRSGRYDIYRFLPPAISNCPPPARRLHKGEKPRPDRR